MAVKASKRSVKIKADGTKRYKCSYLCGACGKEARHYIKPTSTVAYCHDCNNPLIVEPATSFRFENGLPVPDKAGNYFKAHHVKTTH